MSQEDPFLVVRSQREVVIAGRPFVCGVESHHAQKPGESAQVCVQQEPGLAQWSRANAGDRRDVEAFEYGIDTHEVSVNDLMVESDGAAVDKDQVHFGVRNA